MVVNVIVEICVVVTAASVTGVIVDIVAFAIVVNLVILRSCVIVVSAIVIIAIAIVIVVTADIGYRSLLSVLLVCLGLLLVLL